ncbi:MAG TPA: hypothetical protein VKG82_05495 [Solirubrobacteraceae bacterium]|nr:hypothetical protein [Solirubrobacteraceae bacterium]HME03172.1 hypothetical protein [Solirubrobacteraceae bacterium]
MGFRHLSCPACRIRVRANAPEIELLEDRCPICEATLRPVSSASAVLGYRSFDLDALSQQESNDQPNPRANPADLLSHPEIASPRDGLDTHRWSDDGGSLTGGAVANWSTTR